MSVTPPRLTVLIPPTMYWYSSGAGGWSIYRTTTKTIAKREAREDFGITGVESLRRATSQEISAYRAVREIPIIDS